MESHKKYLPVILIVIPVIIAVLIRSTGTGHFRYDAARWAEPSVSGKNIITPGSLSQLNGHVMVINIAGDRDIKPVHPEQVAVSPDSVLTKEILKMAGRNNGPVVLYSDDPAVSSRVWMVMSQTGIKDLYILTIDSLNETLKEKFRADTLFNPESSK